MFPNSIFAVDFLHSPRFVEVIGISMRTDHTSGGRFREMTDLSIDVISRFKLLGLQLLPQIVIALPLLFDELLHIGQFAAESHQGFLY